MNLFADGTFYSYIAIETPIQYLWNVYSEIVSEEDNKYKSIKASPRSIDLFLPSATKSNDAFACSSSSTTKKKGKQAQDLMIIIRGIWYINKL